MKKIVAVVLALAMAFAFGVSGFAASYGDVNGDGKIDSFDALLILQSSVGVIKLTSQQVIDADVNADGKINSADALLVLSRAVGKISSFPVEDEDVPDIDHGFIG